MRLGAFGPAVLATAAATLFAADSGRKEAPLVYVGGVVNAASFTPAPENFVCPNAIVSIFGLDLALRTRGVAPGDLSGGKLPRNLGGVRVLIGNIEMPLFFVSPTQINAQIPSNIRPREAGWKIQVLREGLASEARYDVRVRQVAPGLFPVVSHEDGSLVGRGEIEGSTPAAPGEAVILFGAGFGETFPPAASGLLVPFAAPVTAQARVLLEGRPVPPDHVLYVGQAPGFAGLYQVNVVIPADTAAGDWEVIAELDDVASQPGLLIAVEPSPL